MIRAMLQSAFWRKGIKEKKSFFGICDKLSLRQTTHQHVRVFAFSQYGFHLIRQR